MLYGIRPEEQRRLAAAGTRVRVYVALRRRLVRLLHAPARRATGQRALLPPLARHQVLRPKESRHGRRHPGPGPAQRAGARLRARLARARRAWRRGWASSAEEPVELTRTIGGASGWPAASASTSSSRTGTPPSSAPRRTPPTPTREDAVARRRRRPRRPGATCPSTTAPRSSCAPPTCWPGRGGRRSTPPPCSASRKTANQAEIDSACELIDFWRFNVHFARQILAEQPESLARASGTASTTARSRASSTRSRRSTSPPSPATCRPRRR